MKKLLTASLLLLFSISTFAQFGKVKYKDDLHRILTLSTDRSVAQLNIWLAQEPTNPSIFLQLAVLYEKRYASADPLKDYDYKYSNAKLAFAAYERTEQLIDEKDVRRNEEHYYNFGVYDDRGKFDVPYDSVTTRIKRSKARLSLFLSHIPEIHDEFTNSFSNYDQAHKIYSEILGKYPTFKELYLLFNDDVNARFEELKAEYLAGIDHFQKYKAALDSFDIGYDQNLTINEIGVYRLDGLESQINFLKNDIQVWNYAQWVDDTKTQIDQQIGSLRASLGAENIRISSRLDDATPDFIRDQFEPLSVSKEVLFNLRKFDLNSVIEPIFLYKEKKHDLIYQNLLSESLDTSATVDVERKLYLYGQAINKVSLADSTLSNVMSRNTPLSYQKFTSFINLHYQGMEGITRFVTREQASNKEFVTESVNKIQEHLYKKLATDSIVNTITHRGKKIPLQISSPVENEYVTKDPITTQRLKTFDGSLILSGIYKNEKLNKTQAYLCAVTPDNKVAWYNEYLLQQDSSVGYDSHTRIAVIQFVPGGIGLILNGADTSSNRINHLMLLDEKGEETLSRRLLFNQYPRSLTYSEKNNALLITYKGDEFSDTILKESELIVASYNILGDLQWQKRMSYKGDIAGVAEVDQAYILTGNYNEMKDLGGRIQRAGTENTDTRIFTLKVSAEGEVTNLKMIDFASSIYGNVTYKVSDDCLNIFGSKGSYQRKVSLDTDPNTAIHLIVNSDLETLSSSLE